MSGLTGSALYHGIEGVEAATRDVFKAWEMFRQEAEEFIEEGDDVVVLVRMHGRLPGGSDPELEDTGGHVWTFRDARVIRLPPRHPDRSPRSRRAIGVGDVGGERGAGPAAVIDAHNRGDDRGNDCA